MKKFLKMTLIGGLIIALVGCTVTALKTYEEPDYQVLKGTEASLDIEQRRYVEALIAEVEVTGTRDESVSKGFRLLADFIFGNNTANGAIEMTAPVTQQATKPSAKKIEMTTPVAQQASGDNTWHVRFYMPKQYHEDNLPKPNNDQVTIRKLPGYDAVAIRFSGRNIEANLEEHRQKLDAYIAKNSLEIDGGPTYAFFDPPWTPWFLKRNEIIYRLK